MPGAGDAAVHRLNSSAGKTGIWSIEVGARPRLGAAQDILPEQMMCPLSPEYDREACFLQRDQRGQSPACWTVLRVLRLSFSPHL